MRRSKHDGTSDRSSRSPGCAADRYQYDTASSYMRRRSDRRPEHGHTGLVTTGTTRKVERSGPAIRNILAQHSPQECRQFEADVRNALVRAGTDLDLARVDAVLTRWHARATIVANPLTVEEQTLVQRARAGDFTGLRARGEHGAWTTL